MSKKKVAVEAKPETIVSFKGFDAEFQCRGFQYQVGATYTHTGAVEACSSGFHACINPLDVLDYYQLLTNDAKPNRFAIVEQSGQIDRHAEDSKIASASITITAELSLPDFVRRAVTWMLDYVSKDAKAEGVEVASGHYSQLAASGDSSQLAASATTASSRRLPSLVPQRVAMARGYRWLNSTAVASALALQRAASARTDYSLTCGTARAAASWSRRNAEVIAMKSRRRKIRSCLRTKGRFERHGRRSAAGINDGVIEFTRTPKH